MKKIKVSDYIAHFIEQLGVRHVFGVIGAANVYLIDSIAKRKDLKYICNHHEQAAAMAAESYSRTNGNLGVCVVTSGPGCTNAITGVAGAWFDSIPVLYLSGQVKRETVNSVLGLRQLGIQEINIIDIVKSITKYAVMVKRPEEIKYHLQKAVFTAKSGRPGSVWLDIPQDVQSSLISERKLINFIPSSRDIFFYEVKLKSSVGELIEWIEKSKRPVIFAGNGIKFAGGREIFLKMIEELGIPVVTSISAHDLIESSHPLFCGRPGIFGDRNGNFTIQNSDLLIVIGARLHLWNIGHNYRAFAREAKKVVVDIDELELRKPTVKADLPIHADAKAFMEQVLVQIKLAKLPDFTNWLRKSQEWKRQYPVVLPEYKKEKKFVNSYYFIDTLSDILTEGEIIVTDVGTALTGTNQTMKIKKNQLLCYNIGCMAMGYGLPAAIGAYYATHKKRIILIVGDGGMMLNIQELQTIFTYKIPIKIFLLNNQCYLAVKNTQSVFVDGRFLATENKSGLTFPDFKKVSMAFGIKYERINNNLEVKRKIKKVLDQKGAVLCDINMSSDQPICPVAPLVKKRNGTIIAKPLEEMYPYLKRKEFLKNMFIKPLDE